MTVAGIEKVIPALGIEKMLEEGVPQATLDRVAPGVKTQDLNSLFGALDLAVPALARSSAERQCRRRRGHQLARHGSRARSKEGARLPAALRRWCGVSWALKVAQVHRCSDHVQRNPDRRTVIVFAGMPAHQFQSFSTKARTSAAGHERRGHNDQVQVFWRGGDSCGAIRVTGIGAAAHDRRAGHVRIRLPNGDLGIGSARPAADARAQAQTTTPRLIMRHPIPARQAKSVK